MSALGGSVSEVSLVPLMLVLTSLVLLAAKKIGLPYPILLVACRIVTALVPGVPRVELNPQIVFSVLLPPLLYASTVFTSTQLLRTTLVSSFLLSILLVLATISLVASTMHALAPNLSWSAAVLIGIIAAVSDTAVFKGASKALHISRRLTDTLSAESLVTLVVVLSVYSIATNSAITNQFSIPSAAVRIILMTISGLLLGAGLGYTFAWLHHHIDDDSIGISLSLSIPYAASLTAEAVGALPVIAIMTTGFIGARLGLRVARASARLQGIAFWQMLVFIISGVIYFLIGLALPTALEALRSYSLVTLSIYTLLSVAITIVLRFFAALLTTLIPITNDENIEETRSMSSRFAEAMVITWSGARSVVMPAAALGLPLTTAAGTPFPARDLIVVLACLMSLLSLVCQGLTLTPLIRRLGLAGNDGEEREERHARMETARAGLQRLGEHQPIDSEVAQMTQQLKKYYERSLSPKESQNADKRASQALQNFACLREDTLKAERSSLYMLRERNALEDELLARLEHELDIETIRLRFLANTPP